MKPARSHAADSLAEQLTELRRLRDEGSLDEAEFAAAKAHVLNATDDGTRRVARPSTTRRAAVAGALVLLIGLILGGGALALFDAPWSNAGAEPPEEQPIADPNHDNADLETASKLACAETQWDAPGERTDLLSAGVMGVVDRTPGLEFGEVFDAASLYCADLLETSTVKPEPVPAPPAGETHEQRRSRQVEECLARQDWTWANEHCVYDPYGQY